MNTEDIRLEKPILRLLYKLTQSCSKRLQLFDISSSSTLADITLLTVGL